MVVLKNCEPELSYVLVELFNKCQKESCFLYCSKVSSVVLILKNIRGQSTAKNIIVLLVFFLRLVKSLKKSLPRKMWSFLDFQYGCRSSRSTADLLIVISSKIAGAFNSSEATRAVCNTWHIQNF